MIPQLPLDVTLKESTSLEDFVPGENSQALASVRLCATSRGEEYLYLWGSGDTGKSHLLQSACRLSAHLGHRISYLPLEQMNRFAPDILENLGDLDLVCVDDIHKLAGHSSWERALFNLFNQLRGRGSRLILSADRGYRELPIELPDLASRLGWGLSYKLYPLRDQEKILVLTQGAVKRGLTLPIETAHYILAHSPRDMKSLLATLERLDLASLAAGRKLTVPFVKAILKQR